MSFTTRQGRGCEFYAQRSGYLKGSFFSGGRIHQKGFLRVHGFFVGLVEIKPPGFCKMVFCQKQFSLLMDGVFFATRNPQNDTGLVVEDPDANYVPKSSFFHEWPCRCSALLESKISCQKATLKMICLFQWWDMLVLWRVCAGSSNFPCCSTSRANEKKLG